MGRGGGGAGGLLGRVGCLDGRGLMEISFTDDSSTRESFNYT